MPVRWRERQLKSALPTAGAERSREMRTTGLIIRRTSKARSRWDHPAAPSDARSVAIATDFDEGGVRGVGEDSEESEGRTARWGVGSVVR